MKYKFLLGILFLGIIVFITKQATIFFYSDYVNMSLTENSGYFNNEDSICKFTKCLEITSIEPKHIIKYKNIYLDKEYHYFILNPETKEYIHLDTTYVSMIHDRATMIFLPIVLIIFIVFLLLANRESSEATMRVLLANEALLGNKSMLEITENIHHEMNTPIEIIDNKIHEIEDSFGRLLDMKGCEKEENVGKIIQDFKFIKDSSEQIYNILDRMRGFKSIKYSNGNKSLYDIIETSFDMISQSNSNFTKKISFELRDYSLKHNIELRNADLLSIMVNHIKNSLDANSNKIFVLFERIQGEYLYFRIIDNGSGIPIEAQKKIFKSNFSTKLTMDTIRGNGLYLNKSILTESKGNLKLIDTSKYGTTFEIRVPVVLRD